MGSITENIHENFDAFYQWVQISTPRPKKWPAGGKAKSVWEEGGGAKSKKKFLPPLDNILWPPLVDRLLRYVPSQRGNESLEDSNQFRYFNNGQGKFTSRRRCSKHLCLATLTHITLLAISPTQLYQNTNTLCPRIISLLC